MASCHEVVDLIVQPPSPSTTLSPPPLLLVVGVGLQRWCNGVWQACCQVLRLCKTTDTGHAVWKPSKWQLSTKRKLTTVYCLDSCVVVAVNLWLEGNYSVGDTVLRWLCRLTRRKAHMTSLSFSSNMAMVCPGAGIMEADDRPVTTVFTVKPSFHHRHSTNWVSWSVTIVGERAVTHHLVVCRRW